MSSKRNITVDVLKGWAIITVILVHVFRGKGTFDIFIGEVGRWAVPAFFMVQGYFLYRSAQRPWLQVLQRRLKKIYLPYLLFATAYGFYFLIVDNKIFKVTDVILGETAVHLYFVNHYMLFALFLPFLYKLPRRFKHVCLWFMVISNFFILLGLELQRAYGFKIFTYNGFNPLKWWGFVALGMLLREGQDFLKKLKKYRNLTILTSFLLATVGILFPFLTNCIGYMYNRSTLFPLAIGITVLIIAVYGQEKVFSSNILAYIGQRSLGIYFLHFFIIHSLKYIVRIKFLWLVVILTILICLLTIELYRKVKKYLGSLIFKKSKAITL